MQPVDFFCSRMDAMIHLNDPLTMLVTELACNKIQRAIAKKLEHQNRLSQLLYDEHRLACDATQTGRSFVAPWTKRPWN